MMSLYWLGVFFTFQKYHLNFIKINQHLSIKASLDQLVLMFERIFMIRTQNRLIFWKSLLKWVIFWVQLSQFGELFRCFLCCYYIFINNLIQNKILVFFYIHRSPSIYKRVNSRIVVESKWLSLQAKHGIALYSHSIN